MWMRKHSLRETAADDGGADGGTGVTGQHPATGSGNEDDGDAGAQGGEGLSARAAAKLDGDDDNSGSGGDEATGRPAHIPEQFWIAGEGEEPGKLNDEALVKSWNDTRQELKAAKAEHGEAPEKPDAYEFKPPEESKIDYTRLAEDDPGMAAIRVSAHKLGLSQDQFQNLVEGFFEELGEVGPEPFDEKAEMAIIGKNAEQVIDANVRWFKDLVDRGELSAQEYDEMVLMGATGYGVRALAKLRQIATGEKAIPLEAVNVDGALPSKQELYQMQGDPKYANDAKYRAEVDALFEKVYGNEPAGTSEAGMGVSHSNTAPANIRRADELKKQQQA